MASDKVSVPKVIVWQRNGSCLQSCLFEKADGYYSSNILLLHQVNIVSTSEVTRKESLYHHT